MHHEVLLGSVPLAGTCSAIRMGSRLLTLAVGLSVCRLMTFKRIGFCDDVDNNRCMLGQESLIIDLLPFVELAHLSDSSSDDLFRKRCLLARPSLRLGLDAELGRLSVRLNFDSWKTEILQV